MKLLAQFLLKLRLHTRKATVLHEGANVGRLRFAREHHRGGRAHRNAMDHGAQAVRIGGICKGKEPRQQGHPLLHVEAVEPAHLNVRATARPCIAEVRQEDVVAQVALVHPSEVHHAHRVVGIAMHEYGSAALRARIAHIEGVQVRAVLGRDGRIAQGVAVHKAVVPRARVGIFAIKPRPRIGHGFALGLEGIVEKICRCAQQGNGQQQDYSSYNNMVTAHNI